MSGVKGVKGVNGLNGVKGLTILLLFTLLFIFSCNSSKLPPLPPEDALETFSLPPGFRIELVASEPQISDPVEIAFDEEGHLYVAEMEDYPAQGGAGGRIVVLDDLDGDGYFEKADVFADSLPYVNGVMPWRKGVLVTSAPDIIYLEDTTGDRRADIRRVVVTGFAFTNPQLRVSSLRYGIDNNIYGAYSRAGGQRGYPEFTNHGSALKFPAGPVGDSADIYPGTDFRFLPDSFSIAPAGGMSQFGMSFDAEGNRFTVWNNIHARHVVIDARYAETNPALRLPMLMANISDHGNAAPVYSRAQNRLDLHESEIGHFTSACGHTIYTGDLFGAPYDGALFVCEPVSNIVHVDALNKNGATFSASRIAEGEEFLSSTDSWFRPVNTTVGPDGALYVVDFYRKLVEHPAWIARADEKGIYTHAGLLQESDFLEGNDRGRIYRIVPEDYRYSGNRRPRLSVITRDALVAALGHDNMWWRINAQRLLVDRQDRSVVPMLTKLFRESPSPFAKVHALRTLDGLRALDNNLIAAALSDTNAVVRKHALMLCEPRLSDPDIRKRVLAMTDERDEHVQFQLALTLSLLPSDTSFPQLQRIARQRIGDEWFHKALLLSARENVLRWYDAVSNFETSDNAAKDGKQNFLHAIACVVGSRSVAHEISQLILRVEAQNDSTFQASALQGLAEGLSQAHALSRHAQDALIRMMSSDIAVLQDASLTVAEKVGLSTSPLLARALASARNTALDKNASVSSRAHAIRVLGLDPAGVGVSILAQLLTPRQPREVRSAAALVLITSDDRHARSLLLQRFNSFTPEVRASIESGFARSTDRISQFLEALEDKRIDPTLLSASFRSRLAQHPDKNISEPARKLVGQTVDDRDKVVTAYYESTVLDGDAVRGKELFKNLCSACHRLENVGRAFGPDLLSVTNQTRINLLTMIVDPNNNIAAGYDGYFVETLDGRTFTGILGSETSSGIMLRTPDGADVSIARDRILTLRPLSTSLMPDGLETNLSKQDMADLVEYVKNG